jgi:hypothetical protein
MSINRWRNKIGTDDGCSIYECLSCYKEWEARTSPKWAEWVHCPYCGCIWEGEIENTSEKTWERQGYKYSKDTTPTYELEIKTYMDELDEEGNEVLLQDWEHIDCNLLNDLGIDEINYGGQRGPYEKRHYNIYAYWMRMARLIVEAAGKEGYHGKRDPFMFVRKFSLRLKMKYGMVYQDCYRESIVSLPFAEDVIVNWTGISHDARVEKMLTNSEED